MHKKFSVLAVIIIITLLAPLFHACGFTKVQASAAYTAVIPAVLQSGSKQAVSIALFDGKAPASGKVDLTLLKEGKEVSQVQGSINGKGMLQLNVPDNARGEHILRIKGNGFQDETSVKVENNHIIFLETDKPIYKPGQTIHMRVVTLNPALRPLSESVAVEILDAKGIKIFRTETRTDEYGMAGVDLPLSSEPNLGTWKIKAASHETETQIDVRVEEYVLPKYEIKADLPKNWFLVNEPVKGRVTAAYSFGKPVKGKLEIKAIKYVGAWEEFARIQVDIDGETEFTVPAPQYVTGVPASQGNGNVKLEFTVTEISTGYQEKTDTLLTVAGSSLNLSIIPSGSSFKPGLPYSFLVISETPDNKLVDAAVKAEISYLDNSFIEIKKEKIKANTEKGKVLFEVNPPESSVALTINCSALDTFSTKTIEAAYSPSGNFIHLEQVSEGTPQIGDDIKFWVYSTREASNYYYEIISRGTVIYSGYTPENQITFRATPAMAPSARLLVYQIMPDSEIAADYLPFQVAAQYPQQISIDTGKGEFKPGDNVHISIQAEGEAKIGLAAVDKSVFILAENRMNLQQIFNELEKLYMNPQAELHEVSLYEGIVVKGAQDVFRNAGVIVLSNHQIPAGKEYASPWAKAGLGGFNFAVEDALQPAPQAAAPEYAVRGASSGLAEVQRIRQFFPETWIWNTLKTDASGKASLNITAPDSITTWMLRAVALSKDKGLGIAESQLTVFQPFFLTIDLPYSAVRGEEFPVSVAVYNYLDQPQSVIVQIQPDDWFELLDHPEKTIEIPANDIGAAEFMIKPALIGTRGIEISARSTQAADAALKTIIIEPEGAANEMIQNITLSNGLIKEISAAVPESAVEGSARNYLAVASSFLTQTIEGMESLIQMPYGCGEQNMIVFAPDVYITKYLQESGQINPEIMAKAEKLMLTGYQRELTYRHSDGSFSAFGESDREGSLWLTAFVLKCFSEAEDLIYIDRDVLDTAASWILSHQNPDGSFDSVGFVHHQEMVGGLSGKTALTAYIAIALMQAGEENGAVKSIRYLESQIGKSSSPYTAALIACALEMADSSRSEAAYDELMQLAEEDENGLYWGSIDTRPLHDDYPTQDINMVPVQPVSRTSVIEATAYAALALVKHGDHLNAARAAKWLISQRNAFGGFGSTQDTIMSLQALIAYSSGAGSDVDLTIKVESRDDYHELNINPQNFDVLQIIDLPVNDTVKITVAGQGEAVGQIVQRFNLLEVPQENEEALKINVDYDAEEVEVNDEVKVSVALSFNPPEPVEAGMTILDVAVPTGFAAVRESIAAAADNEKSIKRFEISGRKVIFYIENLLPGDELEFSFMIKALYPVKAKGLVSQAYSYYQPEIAAESLGTDITVTR